MELDLEPLFEQLEDETTISKTATPGAYYQIKPGDNLLTLVGKAYNIGQGGQRLKLAQMVNNDFRNKKFWINPQNDFERKFFKEGIISFYPMFTCGKIQQVAKGKEKKCFAILYLPKVTNAPVLPPKPPMPQPKLLNKSALLVFLENTGKIPIEFPSWMPSLIKNAIEKFLDQYLEEFEKWLNKFKESEGSLYNKVIILEDSKATFDNLKQSLLHLSNEGFMIDIFTLCHGGTNYLVGYNGISISGDQIKSIRVSNKNRKLPIRAVYQMNCYGATLNEAWLDLGAKVSSGTPGINYIPEPMMTFFWNFWKRGYNYNNTTTNAYEATLKFISKIPLLENVISKIKNIISKESYPTIKGNSKVTIRTKTYVGS